MPRGWSTVAWCISTGLAAGFAALLWITVALLTGPGATQKVLLVAMLLLFPVLAMGVTAGYLVALCVLGARRVIRMGPRP
jgi:hypothetical protein